MHSTRRRGTVSVHHCTPVDTSVRFRHDTTAVIFDDDDDSTDECIFFEGSDGVVSAVGRGGVVGREGAAASIFGGHRRATIPRAISATVAKTKAVGITPRRITGCRRRREGTGTVVQETEEGEEEETEAKRRSGAIGAKRYGRTRSVADIWWAHSFCSISLTTSPG